VTTQAPQLDQNAPDFAGKDLSASGVRTDTSDVSGQTLVERKSIAIWFSTAKVRPDGLC